jgi:hypothetical protein
VNSKGIEMPTIKCHLENDDVVLTLPTTVLYLTDDEAQALHKRVFMELFRGMLDQSNGTMIDEEIHIASAQISRSQAWEMTNSMELMWSPEDTDEVDGRAAQWEQAKRHIPLESSDCRWQEVGF